MKKVSLKLYVFTILGISLVFLIATTLLWFSSRNEKSLGNNTITFAYGDSMASFPVLNHNGETLNQLPENNTDTIVFYLSDSCGGCVDILQNFNRIESILGTEHVNYIILWTNEISQKLLEKYNIEPSYCYSLNNQTRFATSTPSFYILNENQEVVFSATDADYLVTKISQLNIIPSNELQENAIEYIRNNILPENMQKDQIVYFEMDGCSDCHKANAIIDSKDISDVFNVTRIFKYDDTDASRAKDNFGLFKTALNLQWYPSFLIFEGEETRFVGETDIAELKDVLLN